ncbi:11-beta-hydroxysteroid dehydrogenase B-like [Glycine max]|uniref:11-beta-hydroxysteroid dehydrogenase B-like n=1 Tax=Glycine max TaxID=3847 RepID=UPI001B3558D3|nr:11-beta-hydroxysteroid dehydrogenase B-like [Glycine max]
MWGWVLFEWDFRLIPPHTKQSGIKLDCGLGLWISLVWRQLLFQVVKATLVNFYETLRFELKDEVGITIATCGWIGSEMTRGKFMLEEDAEMQWKEEREVHVIATRGKKSF